MYAMQISDVHLVSKKRGYQGFFALDEYEIKHKLFNGEMSRTFKREVFERGNASAVLLYDPSLDKIVLIEQFRIGAYAANRNPWMLELVAGIDESGETPENVVRREAMEEAGLELKTVKFALNYLVSPGGTSEVINLFIATVDSSMAKGIHGLADENEDIRVHTFDFKEAMQMIESGKICNAATILALYYLAVHKVEFCE